MKHIAAFLCWIASAFQNASGAESSSHDVVVYGHSSGAVVAAKDHFVKEVDPYVKERDVSSGLLPHIHKGEGLTNGQGDKKIQAYNYRVCLTTDVASRIPIEKSAGYREIDHELLLRNCEAGDTRLPAFVEPLAGAGQKVDEAAGQVARPEALKSAPAAKKQADIFEIEGNKAYVYAAPKPAKGKPWIWYAPIVKGDFIIVKHKAYFDAFTNAGIAIAGFDLGEVRGAPGSTAKFTPFYEAMLARGYSAKPILLGQSRGGITTLAWAFRNPDKVRAWAGIYPVCNLASYPLKSSKKETLADFGMTEEALTERLAEFNPIENLAALAAKKVPMFSVHGDKDGPVPYDANTKLLKVRYEAAGGPFTEKVIVGGGHEISPAFFECQELIDFILKHTRP